MRIIDSSLTATIAIVVWSFGAPAAGQSLASAGTPATTQRSTPSQFAPTPMGPLTIDAALALVSKPGDATSANPSVPAKVERTAAISLTVPSPRTATAAVVPAAFNTPKVIAPTAAASPAGLRTAAYIVPDKHADETAGGTKTYTQASEDDHSNPMNWALHVFKSRHRTEVYFKGHLLKVYHAVFGRSRWSGGKQWEGDTRTPEGAYLITEKRHSSRFDWFLKLNYPNGADQEHFAAMKASREISAGAREGGQVGIHGTDSPTLNVRDVNWTLGCISVDNPAVEEMAALLPVGTLVVINP